MLEELHNKVLYSKVEDSLILLEKTWERTHDSVEILNSLHPASLFTFSHRFPTIHVPKEHEYLYRLLSLIPEEQQKDFLGRFVEYLAWAPKYVFDAGGSFTSSGEKGSGYLERYMEAMDDRRGLAALFYAMDAAERGGLEGILRTILQVGCNDVSQVIGHYFSCTESVVKLAQKAEMPAAKNHLFLLTLYMMQSSPILLRDFEEPSLKLGEILSRLVKKGGFVGYHYMILASGLIRNRDFIGDQHYKHALHGLERILPQLEDTLTTDKIDSMITEAPGSSDVGEIKHKMLEGKKGGAFALLKKYLETEGPTEELFAALAHAYTKIDDHPHDPHYVTFPTSAFDLVKHVEEDEVELLLAHVVEFAVDRVRRYGVMK